MKYGRKIITSRERIKSEPQLGLKNARFFKRNISHQS